VQIAQDERNAGVILLFRRSIFLNRPGKQGFGQLPKRRAIAQVTGELQGDQSQLGRKIETIRPVPGSEVLLQKLQAGDALRFQQLSQMLDRDLKSRVGLRNPPRSRATISNARASGWYRS